VTRLADPFRLRGVISVLPTAFADDGSLDPDGIRALVRAHAEAGVAGFTVLGVMGEAAELSDEERVEVLRLVRDAADGLPIVLGITGPREDVVADRARAAARDGAAAVMVSPMPSVPLGSAVGAAAQGGLPIVVQDYPPASGVTVTVDELAAPLHPLVVGVKAEAPPTSTAIAALGRLRPDLDAMGGLGALFLVDELRAGATGTMTGFAVPEALARIVATFAADAAGAEAAWTGLLPLMRFEAFPPFSLAARKEVWRLRGVIRSAYCRRPGAVLDDVSRADVRRAVVEVLGEDAVRVAAPA
jgi:4-hydroxy-tetrahydrodipicolinate synthase